ncbi:MAG: methenyltetrahydromethanopterin cyclohydrolase [halophilic archaeon J07HB67]|jgi:methenyltetrahydromethanopterin cyclohydrolase (EC 3.5.4.27)|nr:MAG: methenyltetrahydromethanopterin cyclohydrolase [halophilic archaeon J07HB67]
MESINRMAVELVDEALDFADELGVTPYELDSGATVLDFGVDARGGLEAGLLLAEIQTAGLATLQTRTGSVAGSTRPYVELTTDHPAVALLCSQKAGWELGVEGFEGLGSGPARALVGEEAAFAAAGYYDEFDLTVLSVESESLPGAAVAEHVADRANVAESAVFLPTCATGSVAGSATTAARAAELAVFRLFELGYDPTAIRTVTGSAPVAPVTYDETAAMGRTNDALAYGGEVYLLVDDDDPTAFENVPSTAGTEYGTPFAEIFADADYDFYDVDEGVFAPAQITVDVVDGPTYVHGDTDEDLLAESFGLPEV